MCVQLAQWHASRQAIHHTAGAPFARCPRQCVLLCLKPIRKRLMRCQLLGQLEHVLGRPFSYVVLPRPDTPLGWLTAPAGGGPFWPGQWGMVTMSFWPSEKTSINYVIPTGRTNKKHRGHIAKALMLSRYNRLRADVCPSVTPG